MFMSYFILMIVAHAQVIYRLSQFEKRKPLPYTREGADRLAFDARCNPTHIVGFVILRRMIPPTYD